MFEMTSPDIRVQNLRYLEVTEVSHVLHVMWSIKLFPVIFIAELRFASHHEHTEQIIQRAHKSYTLSVLPSF